MIAINEEDENEVRQIVREEIERIQAREQVREQIQSRLEDALLKTDHHGYANELSFYLNLIGRALEFGLEEFAYRISLGAESTADTVEEFLDRVEAVESDVGRKRLLEQLFGTDEFAVSDPEYRMEIAAATLGEFRHHASHLENGNDSGDLDG